MASSAALAIFMCVQATGSEHPGPLRPGAMQEHFDRDAEKMAAQIGDAYEAGRSEPLLSGVPALDERRHQWRVVTDAELRARSGYWTPGGYRFHRSATADLDRDGRPDRVDMVENDRQKALRITYAAAGKAPHIVARAEGRWSDQGLFPAGDHGVMVNYPESRVYFLFEQAGRVRAVFMGD